MFEAIDSTIGTAMLLTLAVMMLPAWLKREQR